MIDCDLKRLIALEKGDLVRFGHLLDEHWQNKKRRSITVTNNILKKLTLIGKDLSDFSLETVKMFYDDALQAGYKL